MMPQGDFDALCCSGYTPLDRNPEIITACAKIAAVISSMPIKLMANDSGGDRRIWNELSKKLDIHPSAYMTRKTWMEFIVMNMLLYGRGNAVVVPHTQNGELGDLTPIPASRVSFAAAGDGYVIRIDGIERDPADLLHFVFMPDKDKPWMGAGLNVALKDVADNLKQAATTKKGFMESKWKPSVIVKVDALTDEFSSPEGRQKLLDSYITTARAGEPWIIPAEQFSVQEVRPLSLTDLAIDSTVKMDKQTVAAILGVPAFVLGVGQFTAAEWNAFVNNTVRPIATAIEQELTRKLIISPKMYVKFNMSSLYSYDLKTTSDVYSNLYVRGLATGNEVRERISLEPRKGLDELVILENYIPLDKIGDQSKINGSEE